MVAERGPLRGPARGSPLALPTSACGAGPARGTGAGGVAIYHLSAKVIGRSQGRSAVAAAAYRSGGRLRDERQGAEHDYSRKRGVAHAEVLAPDDAPDWMRDRERLWNAVEAAERRRDAQLAREVELALPRELGREARLELARGFVRRQFVERGMVADLAVHEGRARDGGAQPHAHVMLTMRVLTTGGFGPKERGWNGPSVLEGWREAWAREANAALERAGRGERIDHRTLEAQRAERAREAARERQAGRPERAEAREREAVRLDREPEPKLGPAASALERRGVPTERGDERRAVEDRNREREAAGLWALERRRELAERGRAFVAGARERLEALWGRAEAAMGAIRAHDRERAEGRVTPAERMPVNVERARAGGRDAGEGRGQDLGRGGVERGLDRDEGRRGLWGALRRALGRGDRDRGVGDAREVERGAERERAPPEWPKRARGSRAGERRGADARPGARDGLGEGGARRHPGPASRRAGGA